MAQYTSPRTEISKAAGQTDDLAGQLSGAITAAIGAMQRAAGLNTGYASAAALLQYAVQIVEAVRKLTVEGRDQAGLFRQTVADMSKAEAGRSQSLAEVGAALPAAGPTRAV